MAEIVFMLFVTLAYVGGIAVSLAKGKMSQDGR